MDKTKITRFHDSRFDVMFDEALDELARKERAASQFLDEQAKRKEDRDREYYVKSWLNKVYEVTKKELAAKIEVRDRLFGSITSGAVDYSKDRVQNSSTSGQEVKTVAYAAAAEDVDKVNDKIAGLIMERMKLINMVSGSAHRTVLIQRYINTKKWKEIAESMNYSVSHCKKIFDEAIKKITPIVEDYLKEDA